MNLLKRSSSPTSRHSNNNNSATTGFTPGSPAHQVQTTQQQQQHQQHQQQQQKQAAATLSQTLQATQQAIAASQAATLATVSAPLLMGGEHSAFRSLVPSSAAAFIAASAQLGLARSLAAVSRASTHNNTSPSPRPSSDEEINVHDDESDVEVVHSNHKSHKNHKMSSHNKDKDLHHSSSSPLQLTTTKSSRN